MLDLAEWIGGGSWLSDTQLRAVRESDAQDFAGAALSRFRGKAKSGTGPAHIRRLAAIIDGDNGMLPAAVRDLARLLLDQVAMAGAGLAAEHEVHMLNRGEAGLMVFEPAYVRAEPGDTIRSIPTDKSHNVESIKEILPEGVETFKSKINEEYVLTVSEPGLYDKALIAGRWGMKPESLSRAFGRLRGLGVRVSQSSAAIASVA